MLGAAVAELKTPLALKWIDNKPHWIERWPLSKEKLEALMEMVQIQLEQDHIESSTSPWNSSVFVIKKRSGKWRMLTDLRVVNSLIEPMGPLQPGLPQPSMIPKNWPLVVIDLQDCFYSIPLHPEDCPKFAFSIPSLNNKEPIKRYQWEALPQGMLNSPTICQFYVARAVAPVREKFPACYIIHYMDDILCAASSPAVLADCFKLLQEQREMAGLCIAPDEIQTTTPIKYLGAILDRQTIKPQKVQIRRDQISTLNDLQKLLGDINWLRPTLGIPTDALNNLFSLLRGPSQLDSPRTLTPQACQELDLVEKKIQAAQVQRIDPSQPLQILIFPTPHSPTAVIVQQNDLVEWLFLPNNFVKSLPTYLELISELVSRARTRVLHLNGIEANKIIVPCKKQQTNHLNIHSEVWQIAVCGYFGIIDNHYPKHKLFQFLLKTSWILPKRFSSVPISQGRTVFTDGSSNGKAAIVSEVDQQVIQTNCTSAQKAELVAVLTALRECGEPLNIVSDSAYVVHTVQNIETALLSNNSNPSLQFLFNQLQQVVRNRQHPFFITHIRAHTPLPGPLTRGNAIADSLVANVLVTEATNIPFFDSCQCCRSSGSVPNYL